MTRWEYQSVIVQITATGMNIDLARWGRDGWELVSILPKTVALTLPEIKLIPKIGPATYVPQGTGWQQITEAVYLFKRVMPVE